MNDVRDAFLVTAILYGSIALFLVAGCGTWDYTPGPGDPSAQDIHNGTDTGLLATNTCRQSVTK